MIDAYWNYIGKEIDYLETQATLNLKVGREEEIIFDSIWLCNDRAIHNASSTSPQHWSRCHVSE